jgi:hypothetical protein
MGVLAGAVWLSANVLAGKNRSFPGVLPEGAGLSSRKDPRAPRLEGRWWYGWVEGNDLVVRAPSTCTPPHDVDVWRVYPQPQQGQGGHWRAGVSIGTPGATVAVSEVDWSNALENTT